MSNSIEQIQMLRPRRAVPAAVALAVFLLAAAAIGMTASPRPVSAAGLTTLSSLNAQPTCKKTTKCTVMGQVTGFQSKLKGKKNPFKARTDGHIVSWSIRLGSPSKSSREQGGEIYGTPAFGPHPVARLVVLSKVAKKSRQYRLVRQSPPFTLNQFYGEQPLITLNKPLLIKKGQVVGISALTWLPNMARYDKVSGSEWKASVSRKNDNCAKAGTGDYKHGVQGKLRSKRQYGCKFGDQLIYSASIVPKKK